MVNATSNIRRKPVSTDYAPPSTRHTPGDVQSFAAARTDRKVLLAVIGSAMISIRNATKTLRMRAIAQIVSRLTKINYLSLILILEMRYLQELYLLSRPCECQ